MKSSQSSLFLVGAAALIATSSPARALVSLNNDTTLFATLNASVAYNDNLFLGATKIENTLIEVAPGFLFDYGQSAAVKARFYYNEAFQNYSQSSDLNTSLSHVGLTTDYNDEKMKVTVEATFNQANQATRDIRPAGATSKLVNRDLTHALFTDEYFATEKTSFSAGFDYSDTNYKKLGYTDISTISIPLKYYYKVAPKLDVSGGYRYRQNDLGAASADTTENFFSVGLRGELTPKLTGEVSAGANLLQPDVGSNRTGFGLDAAVTYAYSPKTSLRFGANNGYSYTATGEVNRTSGINAGFNAAIDANWNVSGGLSYTRYAYIASNRADDFYTAQVAATYIINEKISITGAYAYAKNSSSLAGGSFNDNIVSVAAAFKF